MKSSLTICDKRPEKQWKKCCFIVRYWMYLSVIYSVYSQEMPDVNKQPKRHLLKILSAVIIWGVSNIRMI